MDDEDEYDKYFAPIDLNAAVLAELDSVERKFAQTQVSKQRTEPPKPPPPKRQKIQHSSSEDSQLDAVPIVFGFGGDYLTGGRDSAVRSAPQPAEQEPPTTAKPLPTRANPVSTNGFPVPTVQPQPTRQTHAQQSRTPQAVSRQHSAAPANGSPQVAPRAQTPLATTVTRHNTWKNKPPTPDATTAPSTSVSKPPSAGQSYAQTPQGQRPSPVQRQLSNQGPSAITARARQPTAPSGNGQNHPQSQVQRRPSVTAGQVQNQRQTDTHRQNPLKRQHSENASVQHEGPRPTPRPTQGPKNPNNVRDLELEILRAQLAEAVEKRKTAEEARYAKEGEVAILRANMVKTTQEHLAEIARLQAAREAAEAAKVQLLKEQKEEIERLKTQYTFRQHELETTSRKAPWSAQAKKIQSRPVGSPIRTPSQMRAWNSPRVFQEQPSQLAQTPRRPRFGEIFPSPDVSRLRKPFLVPELKKPGPSALGFESGFTPSSKASSQVAKDKGKARLRESVVADDDEKAFFAPSSYAPGSSPPSPSPLERSRPLAKLGLVEDNAGPSEESASATAPKSSLQAAAPVSQDGEDVLMEEAAAAAEEENEDDECHEIEPPNWRDEFLRVLFAHTLPGSDLPTLPSLLNYPIPPTAPADIQAAYTSVCTTILEHIGAPVKLGDWGAYLRAFSKSAAELASILVSTVTVSALSALFDLLRTLCYTIPSFTTSLMTPPQEGALPRILAPICESIRTIAPAKATADADARSELAHPTFSLLEALSWNISEDLASHLSAIILYPEFMSMFISCRQPPDILAHAMKVLTLFATHTSLFRHLLSPPESAGESQEAQSKDLVNNHIHSLSYCLIEPSRDGPEHNELKDAIMTFFSTLALAHLDAHTMLLKSRALIPCVIVYLSNLATPIWEEDEELMYSPEEVSRRTRKILRAISLLYYLVFTPNPPFDLRHRLHRPPARYLMSTAHVFYVTMSRMGYTSLPCWLNDEQRATLDQAVGMSKMLLEQVVDGPELDAIWAAFHEDDSSAGDVDEDEENEARLLHPAQGTDE